jgi:hypothetical protein
VFRSLAGGLRLASLVICLIAIASFTLFVVNQTGSASAHQQAVLNGEVPVVGSEPAGPAPPISQHRPSSLHKAIDDASNAVTSPFSGVTAGSSSQWVIHGANLLLVLIVYGFGLGFLARMIRVRL